MPNILFIQVDQLTASFLPTYGNTVAKTPHLDALAERSVVFDSAHVLPEGVAYNDWVYDNIID